MKLNPKHVHFITPFMNLGFSGATPRFVGKEKNVQLRETAFVIEGSILKVSFLGLESFFQFQRAITENSSLTIPYQRMLETRLVRWPLSRVIFLILFFALPSLGCLLYFVVPFKSDLSGLMTLFFLLCMFGTIMSLYSIARIRPRYQIVYHDKQNKRRSLLFRISSKPLQAQFDQQLQQYLAAARQYSWTPKVV